MAIEFIKAFKSKKIGIPDDIAVMGYDGIEIGNLIEPSLTTVKSPVKKMGIADTELLLDLINGKEIKEKQILLPTVLLAY